MSGILGFGSLLAIAFAGAFFGLGAGLAFNGSAGAKGGRAVLVAVGLTVIGLIFGLFAGIVNYTHVKKAEVEARRGWNLVPVVVAAVDVPVGEPLTFDMISQRSLPEQFAFPEVVRPDLASYAVQQKTAVALRSGDLLFWSALCSTKDPR